MDWYPGHMKKTRKLLREHLKVVDVIVEMLDARIPLSSKNPDVEKLIGQKPRIIVLNKCDLSDYEGNKRWIAHFRRRNIKAIPITANTRKGIRNLVKVAKTVPRKKSRRNAPLSIMIVGIPNVGKSTLINALIGKKGARTGRKPGVTVGEQWIKLQGQFELLDTPGILWPNVDNPNVLFHLAVTGAIKDESMDIEELSRKLVGTLLDVAPQALVQRYQIEVTGKTALEALEAIARNRGCLAKNAAIDYAKVASVILTEYRKGLLGPITLEHPG
jgi:ribosome biogenesis GTPase A